MSAWPGLPQSGPAPPVSLLPPRRCVRPAPLPSSSRRELGGLPSAGSGPREVRQEDAARAERRALPFREASPGGCVRSPRSPGEPSARAPAMTDARRRAWWWRPPPARAGRRQRSRGKGNDGEMPAVTWKGPEHGRTEAGLGTGQTPRASGPSSPGARAPRTGILTWGFSGHVESLQAENSEGELSLTRFSPVADAICQFQK